MCGFLYYTTEPPEDFSAEMSNKQFWLYLNANGIRYKVCKQLKGTTKDNKIALIIVV